jgi:hypothetical protein
MSQNDLPYYAQRHEHELRMAEAAASPAAASAHRMLADIYLTEVRRLSALHGRAGGQDRPEHRPHLRRVEC